jgi:hypothetical protein
MYSPKLKEKCHEMGEFYRNRAIMESLRKGFVTVYLTPEDGKDLIDVSGSGKDIIKSTEKDENKIHFAKDEKGYFAAIRGRKYYPIDMSGNPYIKDAERYEKLEKSSLRRLFNAPEILFMYNFGYPLLKALSGISDAFFLLLLSCASLEDSIVETLDILRNKSI